MEACRVNEQRQLNISFEEFIWNEVWKGQVGSVGSTNGETMGPLPYLHQTRNKQIVGHWLILLCPYKQPDQRMWSRSNEWTHQSYDTPCGSIRENPSMSVIRTSFYCAQSFWWFLKERFKVLVSTGFQFLNT